MTNAPTTTTHVHFKHGRGTPEVMKEGAVPETPPRAVPRTSRLMALAIRMQEAVDAGEVADHAEPACPAEHHPDDEPDATLA
jgi:hypothetical protein